MQFAGILHDIRSLHNVGSIFRTADGAGFSKLYLTGITPEPADRVGRLRQDFAKVALGAERTVAWEHARSTVRVIKKLKKEGWKIFAVEQDERSVPYASVILRPNPKELTRITQAEMLRRAQHDRAEKRGQKKIALIVGNEVKGLPRKVLALADKVLEIPMYGSKESLNVSVAFGIVAFHFAVQSGRV